MIKWYVRNVQYCTVSALLLGMVAALTFACSTAGAGTGGGALGRTEKVAIAVGQLGRTPALSVAWPRATGSFDKYVVQVTSGNAVVWTGTVEKGKTKVEVPLQNGAYNVRVFLRTKSASDEKQEYSFTAAATMAGVQAEKPSVPRNVDITFPAGDDAVKTVPTITWKAPVDFGKKENGASDSLFGTDAGKITDAGGYTIYWAETRDVSTASVLQAELALPAADEKYTAEELKYSIENLQAGRTYYAIVAVKNTSGLVAVSPRKEIKVPVADASKAPTAPEPATDLGLDDNVATQLHKLTLKWTAPTGFGTTDGTAAATISKYIVYYKKGKALSPSEIGPHNVLWTSAGTATTKVVTRLEIDQSYTFIVETKNSAGQTSYSDSYTKKSPAKPAGGTEPAKIETITGTPSAYQIALTWQAPDLGTTDGTTASKLIEYRIYWKQDNDWKEGGAFGDLPKIPNATTKTTQYTARDLHAEQQYVFVIVTKTDGGQTGESQSDAQAFKTTVPAAATAPSAPSVIALIDLTKKTDTSVKVSIVWGESITAGTTNGTTAASITGYTIYWQENVKKIDDITKSTGKLQVSPPREGQPWETSVTIANRPLKGGTEYDFVVVAKNNAGKETTSASKTFITPVLEIAQTAPVINTVINGKSESQNGGAKATLEISWTESTAGRSASGDIRTIAGYVVKWKKSSEAGYATTDRASLGATARNHTITGLTGNTKYDVQVVAQTNETGVTATNEKKKIETENLSAAASVPVISDAVTKDKSESQDGGATARVEISWTPATPGRLASGKAVDITNYTVRWKKLNEANYAATDRASLGKTARRHEITGLPGDTSYYVQVVANTDEKGVTAESAEKAITTINLYIAPTPSTRPVELSSQKISDTRTRMTITWFEGKAGRKADGTVGVANGYFVYWAKGDRVTTTPPSNAGGIHTGDKNARTYTISEDLKGDQEISVIVVTRTSNNGDSEASAKTTERTVSLLVEPTIREAQKIRFSLQRPGEIAVVARGVVFSAGREANGDPASITHYSYRYTNGSTTEDTSLPFVTSSGIIHNFSCGACGVAHVRVRVHSSNGSTASATKVKS